MIWSSGFFVFIENSFSNNKKKKKRVSLKKFSLTQTFINVLSAHNTYTPGTDTETCLCLIYRRKRVRK